MSDYVFLSFMCVALADLILDVPCDAYIETILQEGFEILQHIADRGEDDRVV